MKKPAKTKPILSFSLISVNNWIFFFNLSQFLLKNVDNLF